MGMSAANAQRTYFAQLSATGIATDPAGNIYAIADAVSAQHLVKMNPAGQIINSAQLPNSGFFDIASYSLTFDPVINALWALRRDGSVLLLNPENLQGGVIFDVRSLPTDVSAIYDIATGTIGPNGNVIPASSSYGDVAVVWRGETLDVVVSGLSVNNPFITRIRFVQSGQAFQGARVMASTTAPSAPQPGTYACYDPNFFDNCGTGGNLPRGVAATPQGAIITTLPISGNGESVYIFSVDFPEIAAAFPTPILSGVMSYGMTFDNANSIHIVGQAPVCGGDPSSLLMMTPAGVRCIPGGELYGTAFDVAVSPGANIAYTAHPGIGVFSWGLVP
jgi:hypothetical protein